MHRKGQVRVDDLGVRLHNLQTRGAETA